MMFFSWMIRTNLSPFVLSREEIENFISPIQKLTKEELREELKIFNPKSQSALLANDNDDDEDDDTGDLQFRIEQPMKRSVCCSQYPCTIF